MLRDDLRCADAPFSPFSPSGHALAVLWAGCETDHSLVRCSAYRPRALPGGAETAQPTLKTSCLSRVLGVEKSPERVIPHVLRTESFSNAPTFPRGLK